MVDLVLSFVELNKQKLKLEHTLKLKSEIRGKKSRFSPSCDCKLSADKSDDAQKRKKQDEKEIENKLTAL